MFHPAYAPQGYSFNQSAPGNVLQASFTGGDVTYSDFGDYIYFVMPADNATISITEALPLPEISWSGDTTVYIDDPTHDFATLSNPYSVTVEYTTQSPETISIDSNTGEITLITTGDAVVGAIFNGNEISEIATHSLVGKA